MSRKGTLSRLTRSWLAATVVAIFFPLVLVEIAPEAQAQTFQVLHSFTGGGDGGTPLAGLTVAAGGTFYGTASGSEGSGPGVVFKLTSGGSGWALTPLNRTLPSDAAGGAGQFVIGPSGALFGTTSVGGRGDCLGHEVGCGQVYEVQPPARACASVLCSWTATALYDFNDAPDAGVPTSPVIFDRAGNMYGTTQYGGTGCYDYGCGTVYKLTPSGSGWTESVIYSFQSGSDGERPDGGLISDSSGNLYGTTEFGGSPGCGTIFELSPSGSGWRETILHTFNCGDGSSPGGSLIADHFGNLYGVALAGGGDNGGAIFELSDPGNWFFRVLYSFPEYSAPAGTLVFDRSLNLYGAAGGGAYGLGMVYKLALTDGTWTATDLYDFTGGSDGWGSYGGLVFDSAGNLYGTAAYGGIGTCNLGCGTIWEITP